MDQLYSAFNKPDMLRSLVKMYAMCTKSKENYCCQHPPLFNTDLDHMLYLLLCVTNILTENLVLECVNWDKKGRD